MPLASLPSLAPAGELLQTASQLQGGALPPLPGGGLGAGLVSG